MRATRVRGRSLFSHARRMFQRFGFVRSFRAAQSAFLCRKCGTTRYAYVQAIGVELERFHP